MKKPFLIGLSGYKQSGKGVLANHLIDQWSFVRFEWSGRLKAALSAMGVEDDFLHGGRKEEIVPVFNATSRFLMQTLGTEWGRDLVDKDLWVNLCCIHDIEPALRANRSVVLEGTRFPNEVQAIRDRGGIVIHVTRPGCGSDGHRSEILPDFDLEIVNDGSKEDLCRRFDELVFLV